MAVSNVELRVDSRQAVQALRQVNRASGQADTATQQLTRSVTRSGGAMDGMSRQARNASTSISGLGSAVGKLLGAFAAIQAARFVFVKTAEIETQTRSLEVLTGSAQQAKQIAKELQQLGAATPFTSSELIETAKRLSAFGVTADKVVNVTRQLGDVAGATSANLNELALVYGQVQAKGRLQGEELLQFQERGVALQAELQKMYGLTGEEFSKALSKGQISAQAVEVAIKRLTDAGGKYANGAIAQSDTLNGKLSTLQDSFERLAQNIGRFFEPVFKFLLDGINAFLERVNSAAVLQAQTRAYQQAGERTRARFGARVMNPFDTEVQQYRTRLEKSLVRSEMGATAPSFNPTSARSTSVPRLLGGGAGGGRTGGGRAGGGGGRAAAAAKAIKDITAQELELRLRLGMAQQSQNKTQEAFYTRQLALLDISQQEIGPNQRKALIYETMVRYADTMKQIHEEEARVTLPAIVDRIADMASGFRQVLDLTPQLTEQQKQQKALADGIAGTVGDGMTSAFNALIQGTEDFNTSLRRIASGVLTDIANQLLRVFVIQKAINAISNIFSPKPTSALSGVSFNPAAFSMPLLTARAMGGSVTGGQPYLVGEKGPELFMPGRSGGIAPTGSFGGGVNVVVNVDASGTSVQGNEPDAAQLGRAVSVAVQAEIIKQQRPGGLLAATRR